MFSIYLVLGIGCSHTKFNQSKGPEGEVGAGSQIKELKQTLLFETFCQKLTQVESLNLASGSQLANMDSIHFGVGHLTLFRGIYHITKFVFRLVQKSKVPPYVKYFLLRDKGWCLQALRTAGHTLVFTSKPLLVS